MGKIRFDYGENSNNNRTITTVGGCLEQKAQIVHRRKAGVLLELRPLMFRRRFLSRNLNKTPLRS